MKNDEAVRPTVRMLASVLVLAVAAFAISPPTPGAAIVGTGPCSDAKGLYNWSTGQAAHSFGDVPDGFQYWSEGFHDHSHFGAALGGLNTSEHPVCGEGGGGGGGPRPE